MKRKFKLFATIASLCLSVALMGFGVYAATQVTYNVTGTVTYNMIDVLVSANTTLEYVTGDHVGHTAIVGDIEALSGLEYSNATNGTEWRSYNADLIADENLDEGSQSIDIAFNDSTAYRLTITINTIQSSANVQVVAALTGVGAQDNYAVTPAGNYSNVTVTRGTPTQLVYYIVLKDVTTAIPETTFGIGLTMTQVAL